MRILIPLFLCCLLVAAGLRAQQASNIAMLGNWTDPTLPTTSGTRFNDVWGYAVAGREFAIIGSLEKVHFVEVTDPANPVEVAAIAGGNSSLWRDMKTYQTYAYSVADQNLTTEGLMIFDLSNITGTGSNRVTLVNQITTDFVRSHNIFIDEPNAILYVVSPGQGFEDNLLIYDLDPDPVNPALIGSYDLGNADMHDIYVENHIAYLSLLTDGLRVFDMSPATDPAPGNAPGAPVELGVLNGYSSNVFNHSTWVNGNVLVMADERHGAPLRIVDVSDVTDMSITDEIHSNLLGVSNPYSTSNPRGPMAHNPYIVGDLCIVSYYHDGVVIFDISDPTNMVNVGHYDTDLVSTTYDGYEGCWGVYPFLPSGRILASDQVDGLYVLQYNAALPVKWGSLTAQADGDRVRLDWTTTEEENNAGFTVERAADDHRWISVAETTPDPAQRYRAYDDHPRAGWNTYRVRQTDYDGTYDYSRLVNVYLNPGTAEWSISPNPVPSGGGLQLRGITAYSGAWQMTDAQGRTILRILTEEGQTVADLQLPTLPAGTYWLEHAGSGSVRKVVVR